jgi:hypothetical protein
MREGTFATSGLHRSRGVRRAFFSVQSGGRIASSLAGLRFEEDTRSTAHTSRRPLSEDSVLTTSNDQPRRAVTTVVH